MTIRVPYKLMPPSEGGGGGGEPTDFSVRVEADSDDAMSYPDFTLTQLNTNTIQIGTNAGYDVYVGFRFDNVTIPQGATINSASLTLTLAASESSGFTFTIYAEDVDDATTFVASGDNIGTRTLTTASASSGSMAGGSAGDQNETGDISAVIQEIVDRGGWASGNALVLIAPPTSGTYDIKSHDADPNNAALLSVNYTE